MKRNACLHRTLQPARLPLVIAVAGGAPVLMVLVRSVVGGIPAIGVARASTNSQSSTFR